MKITCELCPHKCSLGEGQTGFCRARMNKGGVIICENYGKLTSIALDPIEKKPLYRFYPGNTILSVGSYGCNLRCSFCQNHEISMADAKSSDTRMISPKTLVDTALSLKKNKNIGIAFTYNEPVISYEYVIDTAVLAHENDLKTVLVTNGYICDEPLKKLLKHVDAMNIDLKSFNDAFYRRISGDAETVKNTIRTAHDLCHVEVTTLIIPNENDDEKEMDMLSSWIASISPDIPYHISAFYPRYKYLDKYPTPKDKILSLVEIAKKNLNYVYAGNIR